MRPVVHIHTTKRRGFVFHWLDRDGKRRQRQCHAPTERTARQQARELEETLAKEWGVSRDVTWSAFEDTFGDQYLCHRRPRTREKWHGIKRRWLEFLRSQGRDPDTLAMREIDYPMFLAFEAWLARQPSVKSQNTVLTNMKAFRCGLNFAARNNWMPPLPTGGNVKEETKPRPNPVTADEFAALLAAVDKVMVRRLRTSWQFILRAYWEAGLRAAEPLDFRWRDLDYHRPVLDDPHEAPHIRFHRRQKNRKFQSVPITHQMETLFRELPRINDYCFQVDGITKRLTSRRTISERFKAISTQAGVTRAGQLITPQHLRQAFGHRMSRLVAPADLKILMRHSTITTTMNYYVSDDVRTTADALAKLKEKPEKCY